MFLESFLHTHSFLNIFLDSIIRFNELRQQSNNFINFLLGNDDHAICGVAENKISRLNNSPVDVQGDLYGMRFGLGSGSYN